MVSSASVNNPLYTSPFFNSTVITCPSLSCNNLTGTPALAEIEMFECKQKIKDKGVKTICDRLSRLTYGSHINIQTRIQIRSKRRLKNINSLDNICLQKSIACNVLLYLILKYSKSFFVLFCLLFILSLLSIFIGFPWIYFMHTVG